jgi:hypothetical protein
VSNDKNTAAIELFKDVQLSPRAVEAQIALQTAVIPPHAISSHPGPGGRTLEYIKHTYARKTAQEGLPPTWSFDVVSATYFEEDHSAYVLARFTSMMPFRDPATQQVRFLERSVTEVGAHTNTNRNGDASGPRAYAIASAASRAFPRCLMAMYGFGMELYDQVTEPLTPDAAWTMLTEAAKKHNIDEEALKDKLKEKGFDAKEKLAEDFAGAYKILRDMEKQASQVSADEFEKPTTTAATPVPVAEPAPEPAQAQPEQAPEPAQPQVDASAGQGITPDDIETLSKSMLAWHDVTRWLEHNKVNPDKIGPLCQEHFGIPFNPNQIPEYFKWVALQIDDLKAQYPIQTQ